MTDLAPLFPAYAPLAPDQLADPYPVLARARAEQPVFHDPAIGAWVVTRYDDINQIYGQPSLFSSSEVLAPRMECPPKLREELGDRKLELGKQLVMTDPPAHTRLKKLMSPAFLPRRVQQREEWIRALANRLADGFHGESQVDLLSRFAVPLPPSVIGNILGAPEAHALQFTGWVEDIFTLTGSIGATDTQVEAAWRGVFAFEDYIRDLIEDRRAHPGDDLATDFIQARSDDGEPAMTDEEVLWAIFNVAGAGADTTGLMIAHGVHDLLRYGLWTAICNEPNRIPNALEESLRLRAPVRGLMRKTTDVAMVGGVRIPADQMVFISLASANHDESYFTSPGEFDIDRPNAKRHLAFGSRAHACIGAPLARLEARVAIEVLATRFPSMQLRNAEEAMSYKPNLVLPSIRRLDVTL